MGKELLSCVKMYALLLQSTWKGKLQLPTLIIQKVLRTSVQLLHFNIITFHDYLQRQQLQELMC